ncbi:probable serine/threonine-protein kinase mps1 [Lucilia sericata]|uniref:probable serine/threonine-protein kinase mps1 n=1 Tax=Lucilia sericata TaxID=13632 RepID=UPI0018A7FA6A|nr:probable serine/threonine-protein kinase mps1 [Lucilia sericata]XP_037816326.1 probable serine/threonine-protein kinase mps1 [Lucilia sericata]XP_037816327.1 probable serine/threonine-protein kinase mps1 [Lucilia sericata]XP_037816328.1 probable serine/threonine-protein kinase mps1 [Lucilia sericata]XP_037816329.1 probable serine/threonine-protein kinase mps1 [Lucilia sericata]XP_037816330.1 probable serine/threonine-protein kinase mps1 [Lucilia sericata]XP_037816331.1 probable serine/thre
MNCVAIPPSEDKRNNAAANSSNSSTPLHIIHSEVTLTTPIIENGSNTSTTGSNKSQSLQRTHTTHLYCRSLEKDAAALAVPHRRTSNSRGFASCLRGERDDAFLDYQQRAIQYEQQQQQQHNMQQLQLQQHREGQQQQYYQQQQQLQLSHPLMDENHPAQVLQTSMSSSTGSGSNYETTTGRSEYKSKTLPRIHFDNSINDMSLNEGKK